MADPAVKVFIAAEMAAIVADIKGAELVLKQSLPAAPAFTAIEPAEGKPFVGSHGNLYYYLPVGASPFNRWYYNDGRMDEPCYLPSYRLAVHPDDPDSPWLTLLVQHPASLRIVLEGGADSLQGRPFIENWIKEKEAAGSPLVQYSICFCTFFHAVRSVALRSHPSRQVNLPHRWGWD
jgi:hypothetical protein